GAAQLLGVGAKIVGLKAKVHQPLAFVQRLPPAMIDSVAIESDDLEVRAVLEGDQRIVAADRVLPAGHDGKAELLKIPGCLRQISNHHHEIWRKHPGILSSSALPSCPAGSTRS